MFSLRFLFVIFFALLGTLSASVLPEGSRHLAAREASPNLDNRSKIGSRTQALPRRGETPPPNRRGRVKRLERIPTPQLTKRSLESSTRSGISSRAESQGCNTITSCNACAESSQCVFDAKSFSCVNKAGSRLKGDDRVTKVADCELQNELARIFKLEPSRQKGAQRNSIDNAFRNFQRIERHVTTLETASARNPTNGGHLTALWEPNPPVRVNRKEKNASTKMSKFFFDGGVKTTWDNAYALRDIRAMCMIADELTRTKKGNTHVVQTPFGTKVCIRAVSGKTCFPTNVTPATGKPDSAC